MKKVGILTITDGTNYGNRLQNYAIQKIIESMGFNVETIQRRTNRDKTGIHRLKADIKYMVKRVIGRPCDSEQRKRKKRFNEFNKNYVSFSLEILHDNIAPLNLAEKYDYFVVGSDQVWNARIDIVRQDIINYLATFAYPEQKIAYAASFGTDDVLPEFQNLYKRELSTYKAISVRESSGVSIVKNICGRDDVETVLDPTMMLTAEEWIKLEQKPQYADNQKFILTYFLGGRNQVTCSYIEEVAKSYNAKIINLEAEFLRDDQIENNLFFETTPDEFLWLIHHAECVLTDSFHATVFAILFHKPFCTFERQAVEKGNSMGGRIETLLGKFGLQKYYNSIDESRQMPDEYEQRHIESILQKERELSKNFLRKALEIKA